ncbi:MAG: SpvB/TcaC N-terminal domain-containing protein, partial [Steroidobacteraceae bacterium]
MSRSFMCALLCLVAAIASNAWAATGRTPGNGQVSPSGAATYSIPLWSPPGIRGLAPSLALVYSSRSGDGLAGVGFDVAYGESAITRCGKTIVQDGATVG